MTHRFFSWIEDGRWQGNCLLSTQQIGNLLQQFKWRHQAFASIQKYDSDGKIISCPLYLDIDGDTKDGITALHMARSVVSEIESAYKVIPDIFFSGNKGYHVVLPVDIEHPQCHYVALTMVQGMGCAGYTNIDRNVYTSRRMWRVNKSPASKPGFYKIRLTKQELFDHGTDEHRQFSQSNSTEAKSEYNPSSLDTRRWKEDLDRALSQFQRKTDEYSLAKTVDRKARPWTPCLESLMTTPAEKGERGTTSFLLARWFMQAGTDEETALKEFLNHKHWSEFEDDERGISKMLRSLYKQGRIPTLGCKYPSSDRDLMKRHCDMLCHYNDDWNLFV